MRADKKYCAIPTAIINNDSEPLVMLPIMKRTVKCKVVEYYTTSLLDISSEACYKGDSERKNSPQF